LFIGYIVFKNWQKKRRLHKETEPVKPLGSVAETEKEIRERLKTDVNDYFSYLENLKDKEDYQKFFQTYEELDHEVRNQYFQSSVENFAVFLEDYKGAAVAEEYRSLTQKIQIEKYAPVKSSEGIEMLLASIVNLYSQISK
jgi:hypothetical protein